MISLEQLTQLLGWASVINIGFLLFSTLMLILMKTFVMKIHSQLFNISQKELPQSYFTYLANYKILTLVFFLAPYISLKIMGY